jgi:hypothetical protein
LFLAEGSVAGNLGLPPALSMNLSFAVERRLKIGDIEN